MTFEYEFESIGLLVGEIVTLGACIFGLWAVGRWLDKRSRRAR